MAAVDVKWPSEEEDFDAVTPQRSTSRKQAFVNDVTKQESNEQPNDPDEAFDEIEQNSHSDTRNTAENEASVPEKLATDETAETVVDDEIETSTESTEAETEVEEPSPLESDEHSELQNTHEPVHDDHRSHGHAAAISRLLAEAVLVAAVVGLGLWAWSLHSDNNNLRSQVSNLNNDPQSIIKKQSDELVGKVAALMQLPTDETPTIANVSDADAAKKQSAFFANAQNGDRVLMYAKAGQAILYRPSTDKIILVAPLTFNNNTAASTTTNTTTTNKAVTGSGTGTTSTAAKR